MVSSEEQSHRSAPDNKSDSGSTSASSDSGGLDSYALYRAVRSRKSEYTHQQTIRIKVGTWNVAAIHGTEKDIGRWFFHREGMCEKLSGLRVSGESERSKGGVEVEQEMKQDDGRKGGEAIPPPEFEAGEVGIYALGLQEVVDVSSPAETLRPFVDPAPSKRWKAAVQNALPKGYHLVAESQLVGLLLLIYAAPSVAENISSVSNSSIGTGLLGYMGNKGAVSTRLLLGETTCLIFVNSHLSAGSDKGSLDRRNWDAAQIVGRSRFQPVDLDKGLREDPTETIGKEDFAFWLGDLNYRLDGIPGDDVRRVFARHTENKYDRKHRKTHEVDGRPPSPFAIAEDNKQPGSPSSSSSSSDDERSVRNDENADPNADPNSLQTTISSLLPHDQLRMQQARGNAFHDGWREGEITFLPTYKYDVGSLARFDSSEKHRGPSWCDRILYRTRQDRLRHERSHREATEARKRDEEMKARGLDKAAADDNVLFDYDPDVDGAESSDGYDSNRDQASDKASLNSQHDPDDPIRLDYYVSHQGILTSDHKPLDAGFTLTFESVIPHLKAKVHQEIVRQFDKAENEARPSLTVVVDYHGDEPENSRTKEDPNAVDFGGVAFNVPVARSLTVANTSGVPATFAFEIPGHEGGSFNKTPSWLELHVDQRVDNEHEHMKKPTSQERTLFPGELAHVEITALVQDIDQVRLLNAGKIKLEEVLVLRVVSGRDYFISIYGNWLPTCFGRSVEDLTRMPEAGARSLVDPAVSREVNDESEVRLSAPRELFRLTEAISELAERAVAEWSMTKGDTQSEQPPWAAEPHGAGWPFLPETWTLKSREERIPLLVSVYESLDTNEALTANFAPEVPSLQRLEILAETLQVFLHSLSDGIVTPSVWHNLEQQILAREKSKLPPPSWEEAQAWVLESLAYSPAHSVSFTFVTFMLARIANEVAPASPPLNAAEAQPQSPKETHFSVTPASTAAFISAGSFGRGSRQRSMSTPSEATAAAALARRVTVETALANRFTNFLISADVPIPNKEKDRRALEERKRSIVEPFLKTVGVDDRGPSGGGK